MKFEGLLVAVDFSEVSHSVYEVAAELAAHLGARVRVLNVTEPEVDYVGMAPPQAMTTADEIITRGALAALKAAQEIFEQRGIRVETSHRMGPVVSVILAEREQSGAGLIVLGSHGHGAVYSLIVGSVAQGVIRHAPVPVVVVPDLRKVTASIAQTRSEDSG
jgi:nucleotide-binding universal stress UspA family protein